MPYQAGDTEMVNKMVSGLGLAIADFGMAGNGSTADYLEDMSKSWPGNALAGLVIEITGGKGSGQAARRVVSNTATRACVTPPWAEAPDATSTYRIGLSGLVQSLPSSEEYRVTGIARRRSDGAIVLRWEE